MSAPVNQDYASSIGNQTRFLGRQLGYVGSLTYGRVASYCSGLSGRFSVTEGASARTSDLLVDDAEGTVERSLGGLLNLSVRLSPAHDDSVELETTQHVRLAVHDALGREVALLTNGIRPAGTYAVAFDARGLATGTYLYVLRTAATSLARTMTLAR